MYQQTKIVQGKGKPAIFKREEVISYTERAPPLDPKKYAANESNMSRISKKKKAADELLVIADQLEVSKKKQLAKMYRNFDAKPLCERSVKETKVQLALLFGVRFAELTLEKFLRDKQLSSNKRGESLLNSKLVSTLTTKISNLNINSMRNKLTRQSKGAGRDGEEESMSSASSENDYK